MRVENPSNIDFGVVSRQLDSVERGDMAAFRGCFASDAVFWHNYDEMEMDVNSVVALVGQLCSVSTSRAYKDRRVTTVGSQAFIMQTLTAELLSGRQLRVPTIMRIDVNADGLVTRGEEYLDSRTIEGLLFELHTVMAAAAPRFVQIVQGIGDESLSAATPCKEFDVRRLLNHLLYHLPGMEAAARKEVPRADGPAEGEQDLTVGEWRSVLAEQVQRVVAAWADPAAWDGTVDIGLAIGGLPSGVVGSVVLMEFVIHAWDLARATGQDFHVDDKAAEGVFAYLALTGDQGRMMGAFGPKVAVPAGASILGHALGASGRDPNWSAATAS